ncbi:hypothetical protein ACIBAC_15095 [Streptomyces sp. NPDC051362]|uniref:hypothetical protein n=1 Tax=Streptomyces sp. NPDC051362 TaxID=3365651 RepID=UPI003792E7BB
MTRRTMAERKRRAHERDARRESLLVLLSRARRGVALTPSEAALMFAHVEVELAEADELRRTVAGQQNAIQAANNRAEAADAAIVEAETETERFKADHQAACETIAAMHAAATGRTGMAPIRGVVEDVTDVRSRMLAAEEALTHAERATVEAQQMRHAEAAIARVRETTRRMRAGSPEGAAAIYADRIEQALADDPYALTPEQTAVHVAFGEAADSTRAQLAEQAREYDIAHAAMNRRLNDMRTRAQQAEHRAVRYRTAWFAARRDRKADRAAMAAELPLVEAARSLLTTLAPKQTTTQ